MFMLKPTIFQIYILKIYIFWYNLTNFHPLAPNLKKIQNFINEWKYWVFKNVSFFEMKISKLINYLTNMCQSDQGTMVQGK
jgi:hypothetical protein